MTLMFNPSEHDRAVPGERITVAGEHGAVAMTELVEGDEQQPHFEVYEKIGYVVHGSADLLVLDVNDKIYRQSISVGDCFRIPATMIHWLAGAGSDGITIVEGLASADAGRSGDTEATIKLVAPWENDEGFMVIQRPWTVDKPLYGISQESVAAAGPLPDGILVRTAASLERYDFGDHLAVPINTQMVFGLDLSVMIAERSGAYHSSPHIHKSEQLNYVVAASTGNLGFQVGPAGAWSFQEKVVGAVTRIPTMSSHWAWNRDGHRSVLVEFHFPGLHGDPGLRKGAVSLVSTDPVFEPPVDTARNVFVADSGSMHISLHEIEAAALNQ